VIKLKNILSEIKCEGIPSSAKKNGPVLSTWAVRKMVVISNPNGGLSDSNKRKKLMFFIDRELKKKTKDLDYDFNEIKPDEMIKNLKYYPATDKIVGILPQYMFKNKKISFETSLFYRDLKNFFPNLEIKEKKNIR
jgi:hypothetical protein